MKKSKKEDKISVNNIIPPNVVESTSKTSIDNAEQAPFCIYAGIRHAVGSIIEKSDGTKVICTEDGSWQNT